MGNGKRGALQPFKPGPEHPKWKGGSTTNEHGYRRITAGPDRGQYEHRAIIKRLYRLFPGGELSIKMEVEHSDHDRRHNCVGRIDLQTGQVLCIGNLIVLDERIHHALSCGYLWNKSIRRDAHGKYMRRANGKGDGVRKSRIADKGGRG